MYRKITIFLLSLIMVVICGCSDPVRDEIITYISSLQNVEVTKEEINKTYESQVGKNYKSDYEMYMMLKGLIPKYRDYIVVLENIQPKTLEVSVLHNYYLQCEYDTYNGMTLIMSALEKQDFETLSKGNSSLQKGQSCQREWVIKVEQLANKHGLKRK